MRFLFLATMLSAHLIGCSNEPPGPIVGAWEGVQEAEDSLGYSRTYEFAENGDLAITIGHPIIGDTTYLASYEMKWDSVLTISGEQETDQVIATFANDTLVFRSADGLVSRHVRLQQ